MKLRQNESFLRISKKSHKVWYSELNDPTLLPLMKENNTYTNTMPVPMNRRFPRVCFRRP